MKYKNYYKILGITKNADIKEIKKAYRKLAKIWHPDKNQGDKKAEDKFKDIAEAYDILSDVLKRKKFDDFQNFQKQRPQYKSSKDGFSSDKDSEFSDFFNKFFNKKNKTKYSYFKGTDVKGKVSIELSEAYLGSTRILNLNGEKLRIKIKPGIRNNQVLRIKGKGMQSKYGGENGDLHIRIIIKKSNEFTVKNNDLHKVIFIDVFTAILGGKVSVGTLKNSVSINIPAGIEYGKKIRIKSYGMPHYDNPSIFGDLYLTIKYKLPKNLSLQEIEMIRQIQKKIQSRT